MFEGLFGGRKTKTITPEEVKAALDANEKFLLFDVRSQEEYSNGHIEKSINLPLQRISSEISRFARPKDARIVVYCQSGARSSKAADTLAAMGYTNVRNMGGISSWGYGTIR